MRQPDLFYNTIDLPTKELTKQLVKGLSQEEKIKAFFTKHRGYFTPFQVSKQTGITCINSCRRALTNLTTKGFLIKTGIKGKGDYGLPNCTWCLKEK